MEKFSNNPILAGPTDIPPKRIPKKVGGNPWEAPSGSDAAGPSDVSLFSSSLPVLRHEKLNFNEASHVVQSTDNDLPISKLGKHMEGKIAYDDQDSHCIGNLLPDDEDDLLSGLADDFDLSGLPSQLEDLEDEDVFGSGGGMELDFDPTERLSVALARTNLNEGYLGSGTAHYTLPNGVGTVAGEHPFGEHPSRTLFVRNINSNVEDSELRSLFEQYGDIRTLYTACKHRGFVMISYYDIRDARTAMRALQNKPLRRRKLDIHFSIPKDNPSDKDVNQGTLVVFNLDPSVSNDDLRQIFGAYGEVKEIRETPHKRHHKFIEFYDVRAAEAALRALNRSDIAGKRIKLEPSRPGGARRNLMQQLSQDFEQDDTRGFRPHVGSPIGNSPPGAWAQFSSPGDNSPLQTLSHSPTMGGVNSLVGNNLQGLASILPSLPNSVKIPPIGKDHGRTSYMECGLANANPVQDVAYQQSHSLPDHSSGILSNMNSSPGTVSSFGHSTAGTSAVGTLTGPQFLWGNSRPYPEHSHPSAWPTPSAGRSFPSNVQGQGFHFSNRNTSFIPASQSYHAHHVGSAPSGIPLERHFSHFSESPDASFKAAASFGGGGFSRNDGNLMLNMSAQAAMSRGIGIPGSLPENISPGFRVMPHQRLSHLFLGGVPYSNPGSVVIDGLFDRGRSRRIENSGGQIDTKKQYQLELDKIVSGEDTRTTLMIKNIPNKYTSKMLLAAIDENHKGTYDFFYLPIDFKNKCNVGYAFINMVSASSIIPFYEAFNGKRWEKFNSEKVASLAYARIQGKSALVSHFQNSSLMNEDKRCRPILFCSDGSEIGDQDPFPLSSINVQVRQQDGPFLGDSAECPLTNLNEMLEKAAPNGNSFGER